MNRLREDVEADEQKEWLNWELQYRENCGAPKELKRAMDEGLEKDEERQ